MTNSHSGPDSQDLNPNLGDANDDKATTGSETTPRDSSRQATVAVAQDDLSDSKQSKSSQLTQVRLMPPVLLLLLMAVAIMATRVFFAGTLIQFMTSVVAPVAAWLGIAIWLVFFSRIPLVDRGIISVAFIVALAAGSQLLHLSMVPIGMIIYVLPAMMTLPVIWLAIVPGRFHSVKRIGTYVAMVVPIFAFVAMRIDGISGSMSPAISLRWTASAEDHYVASLAEATASEAGRTRPAGTLESVGRLVAGPDDWTDFRGPARDGIARHTTLADDWVESEFEEVWRRPVGPGWSSFTVVGDRLFTQEQRGEEEAIVCLDAGSGKTIWADVTKERFYEVVGNAGPRATPTFDSGRLYALGATGKLTCVDAATGERFWQSDMAAETGASVPTWGFSSSPLVVDGKTVIVIAGDPGTKVIAYNADDGQVRWKSLNKGLSYSSPQLLEIDGVRQVVVMDGDGVFSLDPDSGDLLWSHGWKIQQAARIIQPLQVDSNTLLIGTGYGEGTRKLMVRKMADDWEIEEEWTSRGMKPYFNDFVVHEGFLYGFDHEIIACVDLATGERSWKKGRYGFGQMLLVPESDVLIVLGEKGELAIIKATPEKAEAGELRKFQALDGKTWNHPVLVGNRLYLRNAQEAVCYELAGQGERDKVAEADGKMLQ